jgi:NAD(P)-dependent dehydrogenase (short-subunit alcohol dehydrogenase family)
MTSATTRPVLELGERPYFAAGAAVVIGGSGGIGSAICERLAAHGSDVALTYRSNQAAATRVAELVRHTGRRALASALELSDRDAVTEFLGRVASDLGGIHTLVFAVGAAIPMVRAADVEPADWISALDGDLTGFYNAARAAIPHLRRSSGSIVAVSSAGLRRHPPMDVLSTVPKAGIEALIRAIAREEGRFGVRANAVALGVVEAGHFHKVEHELSPEFIEAMKRNTAVRRLGTAREAADAVVFLASSASSYTTGQSLTVDGGYSV